MKRVMKMLSRKEEEMLKGTIPDIGLGAQSLCFEEQKGWSVILDAISDRPKLEQNQNAFMDIYTKR